MKKLLILLALFAAYKANSTEYQIDINSNKVDYGWYANDSDNARFLRGMHGIGVTAFFDDNFGFRVGYMKGGEAGTSGRYSSYTVDMRSITSFEVIYRKPVSDSVSIFGGIGTYLIPVPLTSEEEGYYKNDRDDDEGYFFGITTRLNENLLLNYRYTKYSTIRVRGSDEWIKGNSLQLVYEL
jgi:hypothetical protein